MGDLVEGFTFFRSYLEAVSELENDLRLEVLTAITTYGIYGDEPALSSPISRAIFSIAKPSLDSSRTNILNGKKGGRPKKKDPYPQNETPPFENPETTKTKTIDKNLDKDKGFVLEADKPPKNKSTRFVPPSVDEVRAYCAERANMVDPEKFVDFYAARGWVAGKAKMKDWRAAVRTWERSDQNGQGSNPGVGQRQTEPDKWAGYDLSGIKLD